MLCLGLDSALSGAWNRTPIIWSDFFLRIENFELNSSLGTVYLSQGHEQMCPALLSKEVDAYLDRQEDIEFSVSSGYVGKLGIF